MRRVVKGGGCSDKSSRTRLATPRASNAIDVHGLSVGVFVLQILGDPLVT